MEKKSSGKGPVEVNSTGGQGSRRAVVSPKTINHNRRKDYTQLPYVRFTQRFVSLTEKYDI
jgi:hypothetical protein